MFWGGTDAQAVGQSRGWKADSTKPAILVCPSRGQTARHQIDPGWIGKVTSALAEAGFLLLADTLGSTTNHGNAAAATALGALKTASASTYKARSGAVGILATSMGSLPALRRYMDEPTEIACACFGVPNLDLEDVHDVTRTDLAAEINTAHGGSGAYSTYVANYNPADHTASLDDLPQLVYYATNDPNFTNTVAPAYVSATGATGVSLGAVGHDPSSIPTADVVAFFQAHLT